MCRTGHDTGWRRSSASQSVVVIIIIAFRLDDFRWRDDSDDVFNVAGEEG